MNFLQNATSKKRLLLQLKAYENTAELSLVASSLEKEMFYLPKINLAGLNLENLVIPKFLRLGNQLEYFFEFLLETTDSHCVLMKNIQVVENKITVGELDFIIQELQTQKTSHIEVATKFYLYDENLKEWIGPNRNDSLLKKIDKLKQKQFPLLFRESTQEILNENEIKAENMEQKIHFKAQLFIPSNRSLNSFDAKVLKNIEGVYYTLEEFKTLEQNEFQYFVPEKQDWLIAANYGEFWFDYKTILQSIDLHFQNNKNPLIWIKKSETEYEKAFVVNWEI